MILQLQQLEMQPFTVEQRLCHWTGSVNLTDWYVQLERILNRYVLRN